MNTEAVIKAIMKTLPKAKPHQIRSLADKIFEIERCGQEDWTSNPNHTDNWGILTDEFGMSVKQCPCCLTKLAK